MNTQAMRRCVPLLAVLVGALAWSPNAIAQLQFETPSSMFGASRLSEPGWIEGKVSDIRSVDTVVTMLRLEDGTGLTVPESSKAPGSDVRVGAQVSARYVETAEGKVAVTLRVGGGVQAP